jgi:hypothetical protein
MLTPSSLAPLVSSFKRLPVKRLKVELYWQAKGEIIFLIAHLGKIEVTLGLYLDYDGVIFCQY